MKVGDSVKKNYYGIPKVAKDGVKYRSTFEADFVNKFLYGKNIKYEYEKTYPDSPSGKKCDFYLTDLDIWIELVYHEVEKRYTYQVVGKKIYLPHAQYRDKNYIKSYGGMWNPRRRKWYIIYSGKNLRELEKYMNKEDMEFALYSNGKSLSEKYDASLSKKIALQHSILLITHNDMKRSSIANIIISKNSKSCNNRIILKYFKDLADCADLELISERG